MHRDLTAVHAANLLACRLTSLTCRIADEPLRVGMETAKEVPRYRQPHRLERLAHDAEDCEQQGVGNQEMAARLCRAWTCGPKPNASRRNGTRAGRACSMAVSGAEHTLDLNSIANGHGGAAASPSPRSCALPQGSGASARPSLAPPAAGARARGRTPCGVKKRRTLPLWNFFYDKVLHISTVEEVARPYSTELLGAAALPCGCALS